MGWGADKNAPPAGQIFFEFTQIGGQMRVAAIDGVTGIEVIIIAPLSATQHQMQALALAKLKRRLGQGT
jgi:hypothetical protein